MSEGSLEDRVAALEEQVERLSRRLLPGQKEPPPKDWRRTIGMFAGDEVMKEIDEEGKRIREEDRKRTRP